MKNKSASSLPKSLCERTMKKKLTEMAKWMKEDAKAPTTIMSVQLRFFFPTYGYGFSVYVFPSLRGMDDLLRLRKNMKRTDCEKRSGC